MARPVGCAFFCARNGRFNYGEFNFREGWGVGEADRPGGRWRSFHAPHDFETHWGSLGGGAGVEGQDDGLHGGQALGDSELYDLILGWGTRLWRVQLKCTLVIRSRAYEIQPIHSVYGKGKRAYSAREIDALVVHIPPCDAWYVLPVEDLWDRSVCGSIRTLSARRRGGNGIAKPGICCGGKGRRGRWRGLALEP